MEEGGMEVKEGGGNDVNGGDRWKLVGIGYYGAASGAIGPIGYSGEFVKFEIFSQPEKVFTTTDNGWVGGWDAGAPDGCACAKHRAPGVPPWVSYSYLI